MKRPEDIRNSFNAVEYYTYLDELNKYIDYLEEQNKQLTLGGVGCSLTDKKAINLLNELNKYATDFDYEFGLPLYDDIKFIDGYKGKQPIDELKDIVKKYIKV